MNEQTEAKEEAEKATAPDTTEGDKPESSSIIDRASTEREKLEAVLAETKAENDRRERLLAEEKLGGRSGAPVKEEKQEELSNSEYAKRAMAGNISKE